MKRSLEYAGKIPGGFSVYERQKMKYMRKILLRDPEDESNGTGRKASSEPARRHFILLLLTCPVLLGAFSIPEKFPSYSYVMDEFDIDPSYAQNRQFVSFVAGNEEKYRKFYEQSTKRGKAYIPLFRDLLTSGGLSHLFVYLSMTESGFKRTAKSAKEAAGLWQFMAATARRFKLKVDENRDERYDPVASTKAAMQYIQTLYRIFGKWYLVMMAYNCGEGRLQQAIKRAGTDEFAVLMDEKEAYIPGETRDYLKKILLLSMMGEKIKTSPRKEDRKIRTRIMPDTEVTVNIYGGTSLAKIAGMLGMDVSRLLALNPHIAGGDITEEIGLTQVTIPADRLPYYEAYYTPPTLEQIYRDKHYTRLIAHIVRGNDTLKSIARMYHATPLDLIIANQMKDPGHLKRGDIVMVPVTQDAYEKRLRY
jgi:membrane-bound lytic murein transglycosylase D